ncbi:hypothetical protein ACROYT_G037065 [Oculina patagonica]
MNPTVGILLLLQLSVGSGCDSPLGMENKDIPDSAIKATTVIFNSATGASNARLHYVPKSSERGAWSPSSLELGQWIQVDLGNITMVTKIATQGRKSALEWVTEYEVSYSFDGGYYKFYRQALNNSFDQVFQGNTDDNSVVINTFNPPIVARFLRLHPVKFFRLTSLRMELYGCHSGFPTPKPLVCEAGLGLESYKIPDSSVKASTGNAINGRLHFFPKVGQKGGWVAENIIERTWFQVDFGSWTKVTRISTQGRQDVDQWVTKYRVSYSYDGVFFKYYKENSGDVKIFDGNTDRYTVVSHKLKKPIITRYIRINPMGNGDGRWISLRADFYGCKSGFPIPQIPVCRTPLGMENGQISNEYLTASSQLNPIAGPENARLNFNRAWSPQKFDHHQWLQVNFGAETRVTGISTQGDPFGNIWVKSYTLRYSDDGSNFQHYQPELYTKTFSGNTGKNNIVTHELVPPIRAQYIRVIPESWNFIIALRLEFYGCLASSSLPTKSKSDFSNPTTQAPYCEGPLGMEDYAIPDSAVTASSIFWAFANAGKGRLHLVSNGQNGGWVANPRNRYRSWFQVDFGRWSKIMRISTQGRQDAPQWVTKYRVSYSYDGIFFKDYRENEEATKIFNGNTDQNTVVSHKLKNPIIARFIRINPISFNGLISLRAEFYGCRSGFPIPKVPGCRAPLGMESGQISNESITASSAQGGLIDSIAGPNNARLHFKGAPGIGAWMPQVHDHNQWLQVDFGAETRVTGISTQGHYYANAWVKSYSLRYRNNGSNFEQYQPELSTKIFLGNTDRNNLVSHELIPPIQAQYIRIIPVTWNGLIALRLEFYGCLAILAENGGYSQWSAWTLCSVTCGVGRRSRGRSCTNPPPGPYGNDCSDLGSENQTAECNSGVECPQAENNNKTADCESGKDCNDDLGNNNQTERCNSTDCKGSFQPTETNSGSNHTITYVSISVGILVTIVLLIGILKYILFWRKRSSSLPEFKYHAFIIYSQEDSHWVTGKLLPFLEEKNHLKCCIHYRDFTPGKPFQECMAESVYNSHKIIAVLSGNFLKSNYCSYELNIAKYRLLNKRDDSLIIIRIDKEDCRKLPRELRKRNFIDYSNSLERPLWESKLLRFLDVQDDSRNQGTTEEQTDCNNTDSNNISVICNGNTSRNGGNIQHTSQNDAVEMHVMERETAL